MKITVAVNELYDALARTIPFAATNKHLPELNAVRIIPSAAALVFVATNRFTLAEYTVPFPSGFESKPEDGFNVPLDTAKQWLKTIKPHQRSTSLDVIIQYTLSGPEAGEGTVSLDVYGELIVNRTTPGKWAPNYPRLFPAEADRDDATVPAVAIGAHALQALVDAFPEKRRNGTASTTFRFAFVDPAKSITVTTPQDDHWRAIIMPRRNS